MERYCLEIAKLRLLWEAEFPLTFHKYLRPFPVPRFDSAPDVTFRLLAAQAPAPAGEPLFRDGRMSVFSRGGLEHRVFPVWNPDAAHPDNPALIAEAEDRYTLYCPPSHLRDYENAFELTPMLALEKIFAERRRLILHSSAVLYKGRAVLFCGASGIGKSTQAALWERVSGAEILNGDRCVLERTESGFTAHGSPFSGSSGICKRKSAPAAGIFLLRQEKENSVRRLPRGELFRKLFPLVTANLWNPEQVRAVTDLLAELTETVPVFEFGCLPDESAARYAADVLFDR